MSEEEQKPEDKKQLGPNKLEELADDIKFDLNYLIKRGYGVHKIKEKLESKWKDKSDILPCAANTYLSYRTKHKNEIDQQKIYDDARADSAKESFQQMSEMFDVDTLANPDAVKEHFDSLRNLCLSRIKFIQREQESGFADPRAESNLNSYLKDLMKLSEMYMKYRDEIEDDKQQDLDNYIKHMFYELMNGLIIIVRELYGDDKIIELTNKFKDNVSELQKRALKKTVEDEDKKN